MTYALTLATLLFLSASLGALGRRLDGGLLCDWVGRPVDKFFRRIVFGTSITVIALLNGASTELSINLAPLLIGGMYLSEILGDAHSLHYKVYSVWYTSLLLLLYATLRVMPLSLCFILYGYGSTTVYMLIVKLAAPFAYMAALAYPIHCNALGCVEGRSNNPYSMPTFELLWGATLGISICLLIRLHEGQP